MHFRVWGLGFRVLGLGLGSLPSRHKRTCPVEQQKRVSLAISLVAQVVLFSLCFGGRRVPLQSNQPQKGCPSYNMVTGLPSQELFTDLLLVRPLPSRAQ